MKPSVVPIRSPKETTLAEQMKGLVIGQGEAVDAIVPYVDLYQSNLCPEGRPIGVFLLLGPTGTGKTRTVEALAETLHGNPRNVLRIDCGEFQLDHEVAKLIGAPPGYLGHRETQPMINQNKLNAVGSDRSGISLVLFDEIEKAAPSLGRLLLGVLDKATLKLGDNTNVNFERSMIFLTSNLGASEMMKQLEDGFGFSGLAPRDHAQVERTLTGIGLRAVKKQFSPEFVNRIDRTIVYRPLEHDDMEAILDLQIRDLQRHVYARLGPRAFAIELRQSARDFLLAKGTSCEYGARELKRAIHRWVIQPVASLVVRNELVGGETVRLESDGSEITMRSLTRRVA